MKHISRPMAALGLLAAAGASHAHISYSGRDFGTVAVGSSVTIANQTVSGNFGWADASDQSLVFDTHYATWHTVDSASYTSASFTDGVDNLYYGDSHKGRAFRFHLDATETVTISATSNPTATVASVGGLAPGFSVYQGLAALSPFPPSQTSLPSSADHDFSAASQVWRTSQVQAVTGNASYGYLATQLERARQLVDRRRRRPAGRLLAAQQLRLRRLGRDDAERRHGDRHADARPG